jgi:hypothetical protein
MATITWTVNKDARTGTSYGAGACDHLDVGTYSGEAYESWLGFPLDFTGVPSSGAITSAVLYLKSSDYYHVGPTAGTLQVAKSASFVEGTATHPMTSTNGGGGAITGASEPAVDTTYAATASISTAQNTWFSVTITNLVVNQWWGQANGYLRLHANSGVFEFWARENGSSTDAYIVLTYNPNSAPSAPTLNSPISGAVVTSQTPTLNFTPSDPDGDTHTGYTYQVSTSSSFSTTVESTEVLGSFTNAVAINRTVTTTLTRGTTYYWRVKTKDATNGYGPYSSGASFKVHGNLTVTFTQPTASTTTGRMFYTAGTATTPGFYPSWTFSCPEGGTQSSGTYYIKDNGTSAILNGSGAGESVGTATSLKSAYRPTNGTSYKMDLTLTCSHSLSASATQLTSVKARWARASYYYDMGGTPPVAWVTPVVGTTTTSTSSVTMEYGANSNAATPPPAEPTWYASVSSVPIPGAATHVYVWHRATLLAWGAASPTTPSLNDVTLKWTSSTLSADNWTLVSGSAVDTSQQFYGTQTMRVTATAAATRGCYQTVTLSQPDADTYTLHGWIKTDGNAAARLKVYDVSGTTALASTTTISAANGGFTHYSTSFAPGGATQVRVYCYSESSGTTGANAWFDAIKLEASAVATPWSPGFVSDAVVVDSGTIQVDATSGAGGIFRLRGSTGGTRDIVELGSSGLRFGGDTEIQAASAAGLIRVIGSGAVQSAVQTLSTVGQTSGFYAAVNGDSASRAALNGDATNVGLQLGAGSGTRDLNISRVGTRLLQLDDNAATPGTNAIGVETLGYLISQRTAVGTTYYGGRNTNGVGGALDTGFRARIGSDAAGIGAFYLDNGTVAGGSERVQIAPGGQASITAASGSIVNSETTILSYVIPAALMQAGTSFRLTCSGVATTSTTPGVTTFRTRLGAAGAGTTAAIAATWGATPTASVTAQSWMVEMLVTVRASGASGTAIGSAWTIGGGYWAAAAGASQVTATVTVDTTVDRTIYLTAVTGAATSSLTVHNAVIEIIRA